MKALLTIGSMFLLFVSVAAAADTKTDYDHGVNFSKYHTFAWKNPASAANGVVANSLVLSRIHSAVNEKMTEKGLREDKQNPDLYLVAHVDAQTVQNIDYFPPVGGWRHWGWMGPDVVVNRYVEGTMIIDMVDAHMNRMVWRAVTTQAADTLVDVQKEKKVDKMVMDAFKHFPPKAEG
jgi:hypothetical protein